MLKLNHIYEGHSEKILRDFPDDCIDCCVTSPPYYGLRNYGHSDQIGLEKTPELYVDNLVRVFEQVRRVLKPQGTLWLNLGDSYWGGKGQSGSAISSRQKERFTNGESINAEYQCIGQHGETIGKDGKHQFIKPKDLIGIPWAVAFALRSAGWYLRSDIIWHKPNPMPESVTDRPTKSHEYIFLMSKSQKYYYDYEAIQTPLKDISVARLSQDIENQKGSDRVPGKTNGNMKAVAKNHKNPQTKGQKAHSMHKARVYGISGTGFDGHSGHYDKNGNVIGNGFANKKSVWTVTTKPYKDAHFATFPQELIIDCIKAGCPPGGIVLDPFSGANTTGITARKLGRNYISIELNPKYIALSKAREEKELGLLI